MNLSDAILTIIRSDTDKTIFAREPWSQVSDAMFSEIAEDFSMPKDVIARGYTYFIEGHVIREFVDERVKAKLSETQIVDMVIHYAQCDAFPDWANDLLAF